MAPSFVCILRIEIDTTDYSWTRLARLAVGWWVSTTSYTWNVTGQGMDSFARNQSIIHITPLDRSMIYTTHIKYIFILLSLWKKMYIFIP